ncbi:non-ribosomal peptide synthetase [Longimicrobium terrae]|uniref:Amino acid adenylation domain-containing protein n=1 Tax=Longimicrobium terrae TaxID=1639882 RepID=A0A841GXH6_9BACT|nr:non-ribosomal peptide synthetase [Longimicrobium terrae]MBB4636051.1 amino acid adenylation domain-containing protein [Longimicrobium terrae]MBB6070446.1 amino acid adenylation domain-containing protein [Longimicrobium terrae]NNC33229.1 amino acid adenylation domain-containing protein [Longimicrobium terrae]
MAAPMTLDAVFARISAAGIRLRNRGGELGVAGNRERLDPELLAALREHKAELLERMEDGGDWWTPPLIRPEMLPLVSLTQAEIDGIVATVPGGAANVQDIYPLAPLQEGFLFHHLATTEGDPYLLGTISRFATREMLDAYVQAFGAVIARHDILRTAIVWENVPEPVQVVWRRAPLPVEEVEIDPAQGDVAAQLYGRFDPRRHRIDVRQAPLLRCHVAREADGESWVLLLLLHHLAGDHTTITVLKEEIEAHLTGRESALPRPVPFRNLVAQVRLGVSQEEHQAFFTEMLGDVDEPTAPFGLLDARGDGSGIEQGRLEVDEALGARLRERARALGVSAATLCHLAWGQVLARASGRDDVVFGTVLFGRMQGGEGAERVMGPFLNTLPIRVRLGDVGAEAGVRQTHAVLAGLMRHEHASLVLAQRCSAVDASAPLFTSMLNYRYSKRRTPVGAAPAPGGRTSQAGERTTYPLTISVDDLGDGFALTVLAPVTVQPLRVCWMMHTALESLVSALETAPGAALGRLDVLSREERAKVVDEWNRTDAALPPEWSIHGLFEAQAARTPDAPAVIFAGQQLTFAELDRRANQLAHHLRGLDIGAEDRVALCMERSLDLLPAFFGIMKAGAAYVPLEPTHPADRLAYTLEDSGARMLLTQSWLADGLPEARPETLFVDQMAETLAAEPAERPESGAGPESLAYVYYTSGSTGRPKGVLMHHIGPVNYFAWAREEYLSNGGSGAPVFSSMSVDLTLANFVPLFAGQPIELLPEGPGVEALAEVIRRRPGYAMIKITPTHLSLLNQVLSPEDAAGSGATLVIGADNLLAEPTLFWREHAPGVRLLNEYGPTETVVGCSLYELPVGRHTEGRIPFGKPIQNLTHYVLDARMQPVGVGVAGELYIGGIGVARGYLGRPQLTAEKFVPDPFAGEPGARFYRTGDRVRWLADGNLEFLGRIDFQVKVRGYRIELGEIEERLREHPGVRHAAVLIREDTPGDTRIVAYWVGQGADVESLRAHLGERLPAYMVPSAYVRLDELPLGRTGKLDRKALPVPEGDAFARHGYEAPVGPAEEALAEIWAEVLGVERVGRWDHFFELGGHSLLAVRVISRVRQALGVEIALGEVFARPVLSDFAREAGTASRAELPPVERASREGPIPLSFAQQRLWFLEQLGNLGSTYHVRMRRRLSGELDREALVRALDRIVARHEALRTTFAQVNGVPEQRIAPADSGFRLVQHDLEGREDAELRQLLADESAEPFDLQRGPLIRGRLIRLAADDHLLLITMHHIVSDGWSSGVLTRELDALYAAFRAGEPDPLPELEIQYADYAVWQRTWVAGEALQAQADYWTRTLAGAPELLELPADHPRPARVDPAGAQFGIQLDGTLTAGLRALAQRHGTTPFMVVLAGWAAVLARLSGQDDVVIGTPTANRGRREIEGLIGFFVNTLALRMDLSGAPTVAELLGRVKERTLEAQQHQDIPFEQVVERVDPVRSLSHTPLFQVLFAWQNAPADGSGLSGPALAPAAPSAFAADTTAKFDLSLSFIEWDGWITGGVEYATSLFERATVERWLGYLQRVLGEMVADENRPVTRLALMAGDERARVLEEWNRTEADFPAGSCVHALFERQAARTPDAAAVVSGDEQLTYAELNARANRLAHHLRTLGVGPDVRVALVMTRSAELVQAELAVLKAGGTYVPLDPEYPDERLREMLEDSAPAALLTTRALAERFAGLNVPVLAVDADAPAWASGPSTNPAVDGLTSRHLAYVMYTSGSTGRPKGVMVAHQSIGRLVVNNGYAEFGPDDRVAFAANPAFDASTLEVWAPLVNGGCIVVIDQDTLLEPSRFALALRTHEVSVLWLTVGLFNQYAEALRDEWRRLRCLIVGGDALDPRVIAGVLRGGAPAHLLNGYGPTETTTFAVTHEIRSVSEGARGIPLGRPISNTRVYVLDGALEPVPGGVAGELCIGGAGLARGYQGRPALTAERFIPDPFSAEPGARVYRTGDRVRWRMDGTLEFLGRTDHQVKVRGFRIEPGEIEARLAEHPAVREAVVLVREDAPGDKRLVAYVAGDEAAGADVLRAHLAARLPDYMVPAAYVRLDALPLTPNGKVDRRALPAPEGDAYASREYEAPVGETETALAGIWADVLGVERVGRHDGFFELGGHSLLAVTLIARMRAQGLHADVRTLFTAPTVAALAAEVGGEHAGVQVPPNGIPEGSPVITPAMLPLVSLTQAEIDGIVADVPGGAANVQDIYPLAPLQEGFLFHHLATTEGDPYLLLGNPVTFPDRERLDAYLEAFSAVMARHDILRTAIVWENVPEPVQVVWRHAPLSVEEVDADPADGDVAGQLYRRLDPRWHRMDIRRAPLMRACIAPGADGRWLLLLLRHHLTVDHTAIEVLRQEIQAQMQGRGDQLPAPLPFRNFVAQARLGVSQEEHRQFFTEMLGGVDEPTAPFGLLDARGDGSGIDEARLYVQGALAARLRERARALGVSAATLCHVAWAQVLARVSGRDDVVFGTVLFGRMQGGEGSERVIGPFMNTLPVRVRLGAVGAEAAVRQTQALLAGLMRHEHASLALAQRCSGVEAPAPLFTALLNYRHSVQAAAPPAAADGKGRSSGERNNYPLTMSVDDLGEAMALTAQVKAQVEAAQVCALMHGALEGLVDALERAPGRAVGRIDVLPAGERARVLEEWNRTDAAYPDDACIHELFEARVQEAPDAVAVAGGNRSLTRAELNARSNRLAHHLREMGVGTESRVAVCVERGVEMVVAVLAVLKAGGAYVPMDPDHPEDRLRYVLRDSAPAVLLTQASLAALFTGAGPTVVAMDADAADWADRPATDPARAGVTADHLAYVIYTSGSTGRPKGVMNLHRGVVNLLWSMGTMVGMGPDDRLLSVTTLSFDISALELFLPLVTGARVEVVARAAAADPVLLRQAIAASGATVMQATPATWRLLLEGGWTGQPGLRALCGGEALPADLAGRLRDRVGALWNVYGPTETTIWSSAQRVGAAAGARPQVPIGAPVANTRMYVLDGRGDPAPAGVAGEICIGGTGVARGYLGRPGLTAERFVPDPVGQPGARMYRTGDLGRWLADGTLEYLGRNDFQVKVRGFRIELGEIEARLAEHPGVREAVVMAREDTPGDTRLVAYVSGDESAGADALRAYAGETLPSYMVPGVYVRMDRWPLTANGKLDRKALPAPEGGALGAHAYEAPVGEAEQALAAIWAEVLGVERVGRWDNFFALGGHSLLAVRVIGRMRQALGVELPLTHVFSHPTVESLAARIAAPEAADPADRAIAVRAAGSERPLFLAYTAAGATAYAQVLHPHIHPDVPVYALPAPAFSDGQPRTVEQMAARLVRMIREVQPAGPYRVGGWSFGGVLAYETAAQLIAQNETVEFVGMLDTYAPEYFRLMHAAEAEADGLSEADGSADGAEDADLEAQVDRLRAEGRLPAHVTAAHFRETRKRGRLNEEAVRGYHPRPLPVAVDLFPAQEGLMDDPSRGWRDLLPDGSLRLTTVPGTHSSMMGAPNAAVLGEALTRILRAAAETGTPA